MKLTVREALQITPLKNASVLAGEAGLDREVRNVNIVEVPDTVRWMRGGEIMFSSGFAFSGDAEKGCALLDSLERHHISALVLKPGTYMSEVPPAMIEHAERMGFPLLEVPRDMPFNIYIESIYALLLDKRTYLRNLDPSLPPLQSSEFVASGELRNLLRILAERIRSPVLYLSLEGSVETVLGDTGPSQEALLRKKRSIFEWEKTHHLTLISEDMEPRAYLAVERRDGFPSEVDVAMMEYTALMISEELRKERMFVEQKRKHRRALLSDLMAQNFGDPAVLKRRCELLQFNMEEPFLAFAVSVRLGDGQAAGSDELRSTRNQLRNALERSVIQNAGSFLSMEEEGLILGVFSFPERQDAPALARGMLEELLVHFHNTHQQVRITVGLSEQGVGIEQIAQAMRDAREAIRINQRLANGPRLVSLKELGIYRILCELRSTGAMREFYESTLHNILVSDNGEELLKTLECYYDNECNLRRTAETLFMHKNSVKYRLSRIEQLLGERITEAGTELNLRICLKYRQIL